MNIAIWKSSFTKRSAVFALGILSVGLLAGSARAAGPINLLTVQFRDPSVHFQAGVTTNTVTLDIDVLTRVNPAGGVAPDAGIPVTLELLDADAPIENGISPTSFETTGTGIINGGNTSLPIRFFRAGTSMTLRVTSGTHTVTSVPFIIDASSPTKILALGPGMTHVAGTNPALTNGHSGTFVPQEPNQPFTVNLYLTDAQFNTVAANHTLSFPALDLVTLPSPVTLSNGVGQMNVTMSGARSTRTLVVRDDSDSPDGSVANGSLEMTTAGPPTKEVFPFPSPFNPHNQPITFRFRLDDAHGAKLTVTDLFGQKVWENSLSANVGFNDVTWDGRNSNGTVVAAGAYYILLEIDGSLESKKRFGVTK